MGALQPNTMRNQSTPNARANAQVLRRQHPLGNYIADFACLAPRLIVELDGSQHQTQQSYDARRDEFFRAQGFDVLRFASNDPFTNLDGVRQAIANRLVELMPPAPIPAFPRRGKEQEAILVG